MTTSHARLTLLPCIDSLAMAETRRRELDISRVHARELGESAVKAAGEGYYLNLAGERVDWREQVNRAREARISIKPDDVLPRSGCPRSLNTHVQVINETTLQAARRLVQEGHRPLALNFANGIQPGGGFLSGSLAQEEVLCRSSALYHTLVDDPMYACHRQRPQPDSSDWVIYSPDVPVFRADDGRELDQPWLLSFATSAAPYAKTVGQPAAGDLLQQRIRRLLAVASACGHQTLVLGAWGCGAFGNDPLRTARDFRQALETDFAGCFAQVVFAITDWSPERRFLGPFRDVFAANA